MGEGWGGSGGGGRGGGEAAEAEVVVFVAIALSLLMRLAVCVPIDCHQASSPPACCCFCGVPIRQDCAVEKLDGPVEFTAPFLFNGENYLLKMLHDVDFLAESEELVQCLGAQFPLTGNPLLLAPEGCVRHKSALCWPVAIALCVRGV